MKNPMMLLQSISIRFSDANGKTTLFKSIDTNKEICKAIRRNEKLDEKRMKHLDKIINKITINN